MDAYAELERLLADQLDGPTAGTANPKLAALLYAHPELQADYLAQMQMHALLQWRGGQAGPGMNAELARGATELKQNPAPVGRSQRGLVAALFVTAASLVIAFALYSPEALATADVVDRLVELNVNLARTATPAERTRIYDEKVAGLRRTLAKADLTPEDRELAETLLENSTWLVKNADPLTEADRFTDIVDRLVTRIDAATAAKDEKQIIKLAGNYQRITEAGVDSNLARAAAKGPGDGERQKKLERATIRRGSVAARMDDVLQRSTESSRRAIHRAMKGKFKK